MKNPHSVGSLEYFSWALDYNPSTGIFIRKNTLQKSRCKNGDETGNVSKRGYVILSISQKNYAAHRIAWLMVYGDHAPEQIDHVDGDKTNNSISNLRLASVSQNQFNKGCRADSSLGVKGVRRSKSGKRFKAEIMAHGKRVQLGYFGTVEDASAAYVKASKELHCEFARI